MAGIKTGESRGADAGPGPEGDTGFSLWPPRMSWDPTDAVDRARNAAASLTPRALWRGHRLFVVAALLSLLPRFVATMGFKPALLIQDSFSYMQQGTNFNLGQTRPAGYPMFLLLLKPFHSLLLVITVQHLMGIVLAAIIYGVLRVRGLPAWGAVLASAPTLFDSRQIWLESSILPDTLFTLALMAAVAILLVRRKPAIWEAVIVGVLLAWASVIRGNGAPVFVMIFAFLLIRRVGWRVITACVTAFVIPLLGYMVWFHADTGQFNITNSSGMFLWSRTMSFANCSIIKPPADLVPLCPENQPDHPVAAAPAWSIDALRSERQPSQYLWATGAWWQNDAHPGINAYNNHLAMQFAERAILAQPLDYLKTVGKDVALVFLSTDRRTDYLAMQFTTDPHVTQLAPYMKRFEKGYAHTSANTHVHQPWAYFMFLYQMPVWFPGMAFFFVLAAGLVLVVRRWRGWGKWAVLAWGVAFINLVVPIAAHELDYRYAISAVPFACLALGLTLIRRPAPGQAPISPDAPALDAPSPGAPAAGSPPEVG